MRGLSLDRLPVGRDQLARHHAETPKALSEDIALHVPVVVLARPDEAAGGLDGLRDHVVDEAVLVVNRAGVEEWLVVRVVEVLEDVLEAPVVLLHDGVLGGEELRGR